MMVLECFGRCVYGFQGRQGSVDHGRIDLACGQVEDETTASCHKRVAGDARLGKFHAEPSAALRLLITNRDIGNGAAHSVRRANRLVALPLL